MLSSLGEGRMDFQPSPCMPMASRRSAGMTKAPCALPPSGAPAAMTAQLQQSLSFKASTGHISRNGLMSPQPLIFWGMFGFLGGQLVLLCGYWCIPGPTSSGSMFNQWFQTNSNWKYANSTRDHMNICGIHSILLLAKPAAKHAGVLKMLSQWRLPSGPRWMGKME